MSNDSFNGSMKLFHPRGPQVTLPLLFDGDYRKAFAAVGAALDAGFLAEAPGLEPGEEEEQVGWVVRGNFERDGETTPFLLLYSAEDNKTYSILKVYLNRPEDVAAFEFASGMKFDRISEYEGNDKPERGTSPKLAKYFAKPCKPFTVVYKHNPKYDESAKAAMVAKKEIYKVPARLFVRWADTKAPIGPDDGDGDIHTKLQKFVGENGLPAAAELVSKGLGKEGVQEADVLRKFGLTDRNALTVEHVVTMRGDLNAIGKGGERAGEPVSARGEQQGQDGSE